MPDAITLLINDHRRAEALFGQAELSTQEDRRYEVIQDIVRELSVHAVIEEQVFYPALRKVPGGEELADHALEEHQEVKEILAELDGKTPPNVDELLSRLISSVREHVREEETDVFAKIQEGVSPEQLREMGEAMEAAKTGAPTHPHPHAPNTPPGNVIAGAAAGLVDKARDALRKD